MYLSTTGNTAEQKSKRGYLTEIINEKKKVKRASTVRTPISCNKNIVSTLKDKR